MAKHLVGLCTCLLTFLPAAGLAPGQAPPAHDREPWVFRCVLDNNARMLVVSLGNQHWVAYDTVHCTLHKVWRGQIVLSGAVYDARHGPQPRAVGATLIDPSPQPAEDTRHYAGYHVDGGLATLRYTTADGATLSETPSLATTPSGAMALRRRFVHEAPAGAMPAKLDLATSSKVRSLRLTEGECLDLVDGKEVPLRAPVEVTFTPGQPRTLLLPIGSTAVVDVEFVQE